MAPSTARVTRSKGSSAKPPDAGRVTKNKTRPSDSGDEAKRRSKLQKEIQDLTQQAAALKEGGKLSEFTSVNDMLDIKKMELDGMDLDTDVDVDGVTGTNNELSAQPLAPEANPAQAFHQEGTQQTTLSQTQSDSDNILVLQEEVTGRMSQLDIAHDPQNAPEAWRNWGGGKLVTTRIGSPQLFKYVVYKMDKSHQTAELQQVSKPFAFRNDEHEDVYGFHNIFGYEGIVVYGGGRCDMKVVWKDLKGVPKNLIMTKSLSKSVPVNSGCSWVTRTDLGKKFKAAKKSNHDLWRAMRDTWDKQEQRYAEYTQYYTVQKFPLAEPPLTETRQAKGRKGQTNVKREGSDSGYDSAPVTERTDTSQNPKGKWEPIGGPDDQRGANDSLFVSSLDDTGRVGTAPPSKHAIKTREEYVNEMVIEHHVDREDWGKMAKIKASYDKYVEAMNGKEAESATDATGARMEEDDVVL